MTTRERKIYISKIKRFARSKAGLKKLEKIAPAAAKIIALHPEYLDIPQYLNDPRVSGCYIITIFGKNFYSGSSGNAYLRICEHAYNFITDATAYGGVYQNGIPVSFNIYATGVTNPEMREFIEFKVIEKLQPILQYTDPETSENNDSDKPRKPRRPDLCIPVPLRFKRFDEAKAEAEAAARRTI